MDQDIALLVVVACQIMAISIMTLPLNRVIESRYCQDYYEGHDRAAYSPRGSVPEAQCEIDTVQQKLAWLQGSIETLHILCGKNPI